MVKTIYLTFLPPPATITTIDYPHHHPSINLSSQEWFPDSMVASVTSRLELIHRWIRLVIINRTHHLLHVHTYVFSSNVQPHVGNVCAICATIGWDMSRHFALIVSRQSVIYVSRHGATASMWEYDNVFVCLCSHGNVYRDTGLRSGKSQLLFIENVN